MAFNLSALGAGLGQGASQIQQQQEAALRQMISRMMMESQKREQEGNSLFGEVLAAGGIPGMGGQGAGGGLAAMLGGGQVGGAPGAAGAGYSPIPGGLNLPGSTMMPQPAPAPMPQPRYLPPEIGADSPALGVMPLEDTPESAAMAASNAEGMGVPVLNYDVEAAPAPALSSPGVTPDAGTPAAAPPSSTPGGQSAAAGIGSLSEVQQYLSLLPRVDPQAIARRIKEIRPDASPAAIGVAVEKLYKMSTGRASEQVALASMMKFLMGERGRNERAATVSNDKAARLDATISGQQNTAAIADANRGVRIAGQQNTAAIADANRKAAGERQAQRLSASDSQKAIARATGTTKTQLGELHKQINQYQQQISTLMGLGNASPGGRDYDALQAAVAARDAAVKRERAMAEPLLKDGDPKAAEPPGE